MVKQALDRHTRVWIFALIMVTGIAYGPGMSSFVFPNVNSARTKGLARRVLSEITLAASNKKYAKKYAYVSLAYLKTDQGQFTPAKYAEVYEQFSPLFNFSPAFTDHITCLTLPDAIQSRVTFTPLNKAASWQDNLSPEEICAVAETLSGGTRIRFQTNICDKKLTANVPDRQLTEMFNFCAAVYKTKASYDAEDQTIYLHARQLDMNSDAPESDAASDAAFKGKASMLDLLLQKREKAGAANAARLLLSHLTPLNGYQAVMCAFKNTDELAALILREKKRQALLEAFAAHKNDPETARRTTGITNEDAFIISLSDQTGLAAQVNKIDLLITQQRQPAKADSVTPAPKAGQLKFFGQA